MAGRPPKPTNLLELTGAFKNHPSRKAARAGEPVSAGPLGDPPKHWTADSDRTPQLREIWAEVSKTAPWLTVSDRFTVEHICDLQLKLREGTIIAGERSVLRALNSSCGLDASGRSKINTGPPTMQRKVVDPRDAYEKRTREMK